MEKGTRELHTGPDAIAAVPCPLRLNEQIAMGRCVEYQRDNGCHCEHALTALRRTEKHLTAPVNVLSAYDTTARADQLDGVRALMERAEAMERARPRTATPAPTPAPRPRPPSAEVAAAVLAARAPTLAQVYREAQRVPPPAPLPQRPPSMPARRPERVAEIEQDIDRRLAAHTDPDALTSREMEVLQLLAKGLENGEMAGPLGVSKATVRTHLEHIYNKLDATNRVEAVMEATRRGLISDAPTAPAPIQQVAAPAEPAKESKMAWQGASGPKSPLAAVSDEEFRKAFHEVGGKIEPLRKKFGASHTTTSRRADELGLRSGEPAKAPPAIAKKLTPPPPAKKQARKKPRLNGKSILPSPRTLAAVAAKHTAPRSAPPADIVHLLENKLAHHREQADKCERALAALR